MKKLPVLILSFVLAICCSGITSYDQETELYKISSSRTLSISAENFTGEKGKGGMAVPSSEAVRNVNNASWSSYELGQKWKVNPYVKIAPGETSVLADITGSGIVNHIWMAPCGNANTSIIRIYWDGEETASVECPIGSFFCQGWSEYSPFSSSLVCVNPRSGFNCYFQMPYRKRCVITVENINPDPEEEFKLYYQITYTETKVSRKAAYLHAQFRQTLSNETSDFTILDGVRGKGQYIGTYMALKTANTGWWGEGEIKFFIDGDNEFPTICGTGTEDYFGGSHNFDVGHRYVPYNTPYLGLCQVEPSDEIYVVGQKFGMYRWHVYDPVRFGKDLKVTMQDLGWRPDNSARYLKQHSQIATTAYWYQTEPHASFPQLPSVDSLMKE